MSEDLRLMATLLLYLLIVRESHHVDNFKNREFRTASKLMSELSDGDVFYDIGANTGIYSLLVEAQSLNIDVISFEPHPCNSARAAYNKQINNAKYEVYQFALGEENSVVPFECSGAEEAGHGKATFYTGRKEEMIHVSKYRADYLIENDIIPGPNICKIDVEGAEKQVLEGFGEYLQPKRLEKLFIEIHPSQLTSFGESEESVKQFLWAAGYDTQSISQPGGTYHLIAKKEK